MSDRAPDQPARDETEGAVVAGVTRLLREGRLRPGAWKASLLFALGSYRRNRPRLLALRRSYFRTAAVLAALTAGLMVYVFAMVSLAHALATLAVQLVYGAGVLKVTEYHLVLVRDDTGRHYERFGIANTVTLMRLVLIPSVAAMILFVPAYPRIGTATFVLCAVTATSDQLDGMLARGLRQTSVFGRVYDPIVDLFFNPTASVALSIVGAFPWWVTALVVLRYGVALAGGVAIWVWNEPFTLGSTVVGKLTAAALAWTGCFAAIRLCFAAEWVTDGFLAGWFIASGLLAIVNVVHHAIQGVALLRRRRER